MAWTNIGIGEPEGAGLEGAMAWGNFDVAIEGKQPGPERKMEEEENATGGSSGPAGGAAGGIPANNLSCGGKR